MLQLVSLVLIVVLWPAHTAAVTQPEVFDPIPGTESLFAYSPNVIQKPLYDPVELAALDTPPQLPLSADKPKSKWTQTKMQCVPYARMRTGLPIYGLARLVATNSDQPVVGGAVKLNMSSAGHWGVVVAVDLDNRILTYDDANGDGKGSIVLGRTIPLDSPLILGYLN